MSFRGSLVVGSGVCMGAGGGGVGFCWELDRESAWGQGLGFRVLLVVWRGGAGMGSKGTF